MNKDGSFRKTVKLKKTQLSIDVSRKYIHSDIGYKWNMLLLYENYKDTLWPKGIKISKDISTLETENWRDQLGKYIYVTTAEIFNFPKFLRTFQEFVRNVWGNWLRELNLLLPQNISYKSFKT